MNCSVLVLGAGGLGCEILKNLVMCNVSSIDIIDMDTIELTNLNRQFLFSDQDIGKPKATTAIKYIKTHFPNLPIKLNPLVCDLTTLNNEFYEKFDFIISGLDAIKPRRFVNEIIAQIAHKTSFEKVIPFIDGGTEGLKGHVKTIIPGFTACWECSINTLPKGQDNLPMCTIINNPRNLKHVIEYIITIIYPLGSIKWEEDSIEDNTDKIYQNILDASFKRAKEFNIDTNELNLAYVMGVIKRIIPSVSSMNAMIAANTCNEFLKIYHDLIDVTDSGNIQANNFTILNGADGCFSYSFQYERLTDCPVCSKLYS
ncbi:similar to Saccharomyces cerevisiae YPR066W UBA3 Protein that acts together with Ula1p to activate Rub1p before its conjugation to proteins (neddylation) [Maudiozyma saulgeensis]|uniref:NEDD8-activating enzyme E1 catalytic subunit n=1 Tax=Maudiozyma saulgeensis TaxID=1789683 RepID=A0A1X7QXG6_9SACH|nr:similar to Saccharomyces cerevisiae YPR066W UBA3 Protein that acts together with Ula1p to activate Rub1p before its conjugation to proteins (neddylation) [Kazachstania saulgeensis]